MPEKWDHFKSDLLRQEEARRLFWQIWTLLALKEETFRFKVLLQVQQSQKGVYLSCVRRSVFSFIFDFVQRLQLDLSSLSKERDMFCWQLLKLYMARKCYLRLTHVLRHAAVLHPSPDIHDKDFSSVYLSNWLSFLKKHRWNWNMVLSQNTSSLLVIFYSKKYEKTWWGKLSRDEMLIM